MTTTSATETVSSSGRILVGVLVATVAGYVWKMEEEREGVDATWLCCLVILAAIVLPSLAKASASSAETSSRSAPKAEKEE